MSMSAASTPTSLDDYVIVQPASFRDLPLRFKSPEHRNENQNQFSEDEFEFISSPDTVRSLTSTPSAQSVIIDDDVSDQSQDSESEAALSVTHGATRSPTPGRFSAGTEKSSPQSLADVPTIASPQQIIHTANPLVVSSIRYPYVYTTPSEDGYPGTGVLSCPRPQSPGFDYCGDSIIAKDETERARKVRQNHPPSFVYTPSQTTTYAPNLHRNLLYYGHTHIDLAVMDQLVDSACNNRLSNNLQTPACRDAVLRFQMMKRLRNLPPDHPVVRKTAAEPSRLPYPYQTHWTSHEHRNLYLNVFTETEKAAVPLLADTHRTHFHTECLFEDITTTPYKSFHPYSYIGQEARLAGQQLASSIQRSSFSSLSEGIIRTILHNDELRYATQQKICAEVLRLRNNALTSEMESAVNDNSYYPPGTFECQNRRKRILLTDHLQRVVLSETFDETLGDLILQTPAPQGLKGMPSPDVSHASNHEWEDYQLQLMLLEQQNKKHLMMARTAEAACSPTSTEGADEPNHALQDYELQLRLLEQQSKKADFDG